MDSKYIELLSKTHAAEDQRDAQKAKYQDERRKSKMLQVELKQVRDNYNAVLALKEPSPVVKIKPKGRRSKSESVAILQCSDWHVGETVTGESVHGKNEFNLEIADSRINELYCKTVELVEIERKATKIDTLVMWLGGDLMNGYLREEDLETNSLSPIEEAIWLKQRLQAGIDYFLGHFDKIVLPCSSGNHGRLTKKVQITTEHQNSMEYMLYSMLAKEYENNKHVTFVNPKSTFTWVNIFNRDMRFHHGTFIRGGSGIGGIYPSLFKYLHRQNQTKPAFMDFIGHFHRYTPGETFVINPALIGYNAYAQAMGFGYEPAAQALTFIEKDLGVSGMRKVYLQ